MPDQLDKHSQYFKAAASSFLAASKRCEMNSLENLLVMSRLVFSTTHSIHSIQRERGASTLYLSGDVQSYLDQLNLYRLETDDSLTQLTEAWQVNDEVGTKGVDHTRLFNCLAHTSHALASLSELRRKIQAREISVEGTFEAYSDLIRNLLSIVFEAADCAEDPSISKLLVALFHFMEGKEYAGQERAIGSGALAFSELESMIITQIQRSISEQNRCFEIFEKFADQASLLAWREMQHDANTTQLKTLRLQITQVNSLFSAEFCSIWFECTSRRIDVIKKIETRLVESFQSVCTAKLNEISCQKHEATSHVSDHSSGFIIYSRDAYFEEPGMIHSGLNSKYLGKSLIELLQHQAEHLQRLNEELTQTKEALHERKLIDKAKSLLIKHRGLSEQQAYKMLRDLSMKQNCRMVVIAKRLIEMEGIL